jgi:NADPH-dependent curcumin reductase CurA
MTRLVNRRVVLARRPAGRIRAEDFGLDTFELGEIPPDHLVLRVLLIQIAPAARAVMTISTAFDRTDVGDGILCALVGVVVVTPAGGPAIGSLVMSYGLWEEYAVVPAAQARPVIEGHPLVDNLGPLGLNGLTAYFGMIHIGSPHAGQTVVVSAAARGVGHLAGQLARISGARVVGVTGSDAKNRRLHAEFGFEHTVNHRSPSFPADLADACGRQAPMSSSTTSVARSCRP